MTANRLKTCVPLHCFGHRLHLPIGKYLMANGINTPASYCESNIWQHYFLTSWYDAISRSSRSSPRSHYQQFTDPPLPVVRPTWTQWCLRPIPEAYGGKKKLMPTYWGSNQHLSSSFTWMDSLSGCMRSLGPGNWVPSNQLDSSKQRVSHHMLRWIKTAWWGSHSTQVHNQGQVSVCS